MSQVKEYAIYLCEECIDGISKECHTPGCALFLRTVDFHIDNARSKLGAATRIQAAIKAATGRLIEP